MVFAEMAQLIAVGCALLGTGSWVGWTIRGHDRRLRALEQEMPKKLNGAAHDRKRDEIVGGFDDRLSLLEATMPKDLDRRLRAVEDGKLSIRAHATICSTAMRTVEVQVGNIEKMLRNQEKRLQKGDDLFLKLSNLAGRMEQHLNHSGSKKGGP